MIRSVARSALVLAFAFASIAPRALASDLRERDFDLRGIALKDAVIQIASAAGVSIDTHEMIHCGYASVWLQKRLSVEAAFDDVLRGTPCRAEVISSGVFRVVARRPAIRSPSASDAPSAMDQRPSVTDVSELVVAVARRLPVLAGQSAASSIISKSTLVSQGIHDTTNLALVTPSLTVTNLGLGRDKISVRGLSDGPLTGQSQSMVGLYLDDVRLTYNSPDPNLKMVDIQEVDVLRGPQGALFGAGSLGGVVQIISTPPNSARAAFEGTGTGSTTAHGAPSQAFDGVLNLPTPDQHGAVRIVAYEDFAGGYLDNPMRHADATNQTLRRGARLTADYRLADAWRITVGGVWQEIESSDSQYGSAGSANFTRNTQMPEPHDSDYSAYHASLNGETTLGHLSWTVASVRHSGFSRYDATIAPPTDPGGSPAAFDDQYKSKELTSDVTLRAHDPRIEWLVGVFVANGDETRRMTLIPVAFPNTLALSLDSMAVRRDASFYGQITALLGVNFKLTLGGRAFVYQTRYTSNGRTAGNSAISQYDGVAKQKGFAPKIMLASAPTLGWSSYLLASEGYRGNGDNVASLPGQVFSNNGNQSPRRSYAGDELWNFELGASFSALDGRLTSHIALFEAIWRNIQSDQLLPNGLPFTTNIGDGRNVGLESELNYRQGGLSLGGEALFNGPELVKTVNGYRGRPDTGLSVSPDISGAVFGSYDWTYNASVRLRLNGRVSYIGTSNLALAGASSPKMGGYMVGRVSLEASYKRWCLTLAVDNPTGTIGNSFAYGNPFSSKATQQITPLRPVTTSLGLAVSF